MSRAFLMVVLAAMAAAPLPAPLGAASADMPVVVITLKDHRFTPDTIAVPAGRKIRVELTNRDATADDFDSDALHVDRDVKPHEHVSFVIGPLKPGHYPFKGELHADTAHGEVVAE